MKLLAGWFRQGRRFAVGALTVGSALPHLLCAIGAVGAGIAASVRARRSRACVRRQRRRLPLCGASVRLPGLPSGPVVLIRGAAIVADSAQFSAAVSELAEESYVGTPPDRRCFLLTTISVQLVPIVVDAVG
ncbi:hypothetical protein [Halobellus ruber]|uniref:hypothetical protein n=1 Tax=Halobellus ruber TaxID=2761102 RepID=UPI001C89662D|nr:hypothetical protein [Halobellus ruber]